MEAVLFDQYRAFVYKHSGVSLEPEKRFLVSARVAKRMRALGIPSETAYYKHLESTPEELPAFIDVITTHVTAFYREPDHFSILEKDLAARIKSGKKKLRLWCAAASTGEEPYTMAMSLTQAVKASDGRDVDARILATDISTHSLETALQGRYTLDKTATIPGHLRGEFFETLGSHGETCEVREPLKALVDFHRLNLADIPYPMQGPLDAVFLRNVMIYFDIPVRQKIITEMERLLGNHGLLYIGHAESLLGIRHHLTAVGPSVYQHRKGFV